MHCCPSCSFREVLSAKMARVPLTWALEEHAVEVKQLVLAAPVKSLAFGTTRLTPEGLPKLLFVGAGPQLSVYDLPSGDLLARLPFAMPPGGSIYAIKLCMQTNLFYYSGNSDCASQIRTKRKERKFCCSDRSGSQYCI
mgnify:CR=1 FL=1